MKPSGWRPEEYANNPPAPADGSAAPLTNYDQAVVAAKDALFASL